MRRVTGRPTGTSSDRCSQIDKIFSFTGRGTRRSEKLKLFFLNLPIGLSVAQCTCALVQICAHTLTSALVSSSYFLFWHVFHT